MSGTRRERIGVWLRGFLAFSFCLIGQYGARKIILQLGHYLDFIGKVGGSCEQMSVSYKNSNEALELNVGSRLSGRVHLPKLVQGVPSRHSGVHWGKGCISWQHVAWHSMEWQVWWYYLRPLRHPKKWHWEWTAVPGCLVFLPGATWCLHI